MFETNVLLLMITAIAISAFVVVIIMKDMTKNNKNL